MRRRPAIEAGRSAERVTPDDLLVTDILALAVWGVHWVSPRLGLTYGAAFNRHVDLYDRRRGEVGVRVRLLGGRPSAS